MRVGLFLCEWFACLQEKLEKPKTMTREERLLLLQNLRRNAGALVLLLGMRANAPAKHACAATVTPCIPAGRYSAHPPRHRASTTTAREPGSGSGSN